MMKQFLSIVLREQFTFFYRAGYTFIPLHSLILFEGEIDDLVKEMVVKMFKTTTPFFYDEEYLILHLEKTPTNESEFVQFEINDIVAVYPLSKQAKTSIESKIDQRIRLEKPIFETILPSIEKDIEKKEIEKAISALWTTCKIEYPIEKYVANIGLENIFNGLEYRKHGTKANKIQQGNYWEYLIAYDRFDYFPNSTLGYFYDAGQVFAYSIGHQSFEGSSIYNFLEKLNSVNTTAKLPDIINYLEIEEHLKNYVSKTTAGDIKQYIVTPLYLMLRDEIRNSDDISQTKLFKNLDYLKKFEDSFNYAIILLGSFFGFRKFYDNYYESLNLRFYKDYKTSQKQTTTEVQIEEHPKDSTDFSNTDNTLQNHEEELKQTNEIQPQNKSEEKTINTPSVEQQILDDDKEIEKPFKKIISQQNYKENISDIANTIQFPDEEIKQTDKNLMESKSQENTTDTPSAEQQNLYDKKEIEKPIKNSISQQVNEYNVFETDNTVKFSNEEKKETNEIEQETKNQENTLDQPSVVQQILDDNTENEKPIRNSMSQHVNEDSISGILTQYQNIINQALDKQQEVKLVDIVTMIKEQTGNKVQNGIVENVAKQMKGIELIKIGKATGVRRVKSL